MIGMMENTVGGLKPFTKKYGEPLQNEEQREQSPICHSSDPDESEYESSSNSSGIEDEKLERENEVGEACGEELPKCTADPFIAANSDILPLDSPADTVNTLKALQSHIMASENRNFTNLERQLLATIVRHGIFNAKKPLNEDTVIPEEQVNAIEVTASKSPGKELAESPSVVPDRPTELVKSPARGDSPRRVLLPTPTPPPAISKVGAKLQARLNRFVDVDSPSNQTNLVYTSIDEQCILPQLNDQPASLSLDLQKELGKKMDITKLSSRLNVSIHLDEQPTLDILDVNCKKDTSGPAFEDLLADFKKAKEKKLSDETHLDNRPRPHLQSLRPRRTDIRRNMRQSSERSKCKSVIKRQTDQSCDLEQHREKRRIVKRLGSDSSTSSRRRSVKIIRNTSVGDESGDKSGHSCHRINDKKNSPGFCYRNENDSDRALLRRDRTERSATDTQQESLINEGKQDHIYNNADTDSVHEPAGPLVNEVEQDDGPAAVNMIAELITKEVLSRMTNNDSETVPVAHDADSFEQDVSNLSNSDFKNDSLHEFSHRESPDKYKHNVEGSREVEQPQMTKKPTVDHLSDIEENGNTDFPDKLPAIPRPPHKFSRPQRGIPDRPHKHPPPQMFQMLHGTATQRPAPCPDPYRPPPPLEYPGPLQHPGPIQHPGSSQNLGHIQHQGPIQHPGQIQHPVQIQPPGSTQHSGPVQISGPIPHLGPIQPPGPLQLPGPFQLPGPLQLLGPLRHPGPLQHPGPMRFPPPPNHPGPLKYPDQIPPPREGFHPRPHVHIPVKNCQNSNLITLTGKPQYRPPQLVTTINTPITSYKPRPPALVWTRKAAEKTDVTQSASQRSEATSTTKISFSISKSTPPIISSSQSAAFSNHNSDSEEEEGEVKPENTIPFLKPSTVALTTSSNSLPSTKPSATTSSSQSVPTSELEYIDLKNPARDVPKVSAAVTKIESGDAATKQFLKPRKGFNMNLIKGPYKKQSNLHDQMEHPETRGRGRERGRDEFDYREYENDYSDWDRQ